MSPDDLSDFAAELLKQYMRLNTDYERLKAIMQATEEILSCPHPSVPIMTVQLEHGIPTVKLQDRID